MEMFSDFDTKDEPIELPPGFRFHPTDEELITHYLSPKVLDSTFSAKAIGEVDLNKVEPWDLPWKAKMGEKEWYFFCVRDRKYPTGLRTNRATNAGYWKATGKDKEIFRAKFLVGMRKTLVFYRGRAPKGEKTNWVMHEYRLESKHCLHNVPKTEKIEWVICRIFKKNSRGKTVDISGLARNTNGGDESQTSDLPPPMDLSSDENRTNTAEGSSHVTCFSNPIMDARDVTIDDFTSTSRSCVFSPFQFIFPRDFNPNPIYSSQIIPFADNLNCPGSVLMQDQSIVKILLDKNVPNTKQNAKEEFSEDLSVQEVGLSKPYEDRDFSNCFNAPVDLDCLWNY